MIKLLKQIWENKYLLLILLLGGVLRFTNLGYSDFQGDEIKALFLPEQGQTVMEFLLDQRKGPLQFLITYLLKFIDPNYINQFLMRLPFAIAGFVAVYFFYKLVREMFNERVAFYSSFFFATNGFLVAFSRIVQYQSFVIMFMLGSLYFLKKKRIYLGLIFWALSILSHYDGVFIFPLAFYFMYEYLYEGKEPIKESKSINKNNLKHFLLSGFISLAMLLVFYIPFGVNIYEDSATQDYWSGRLTGDVSSKLSSSTYLFTVYQPIYVIHIYTLLIVLGIIFVLLHLLFTKTFFITSKLEKIKIYKKYISSLFNKLSKDSFKKSYIVMTTLSILVPLLFMEVLVYIPGTHIYTYLIPLFIYLGFGILLVSDIIKNFLNFKIIKMLFSLGIFIIFAFIFLQTYAVFVDNTQEYPWEEEKFLLWTFPKPTPTYHLSMFGFPYFRDWEGIQNFILSSEHRALAYSTNERTSISRRYVTLTKDANLAGHYIYIINPQTFTNEIGNEKVEYWASKHAPDYVYERNGKELVNIYIMETGGLSEIILKGF